MPDELDEQDLARRQREIAAAMDETLKRQAELRRRQDELLERLGGIDRALDKRAGDEPERQPGD
ncbi:MAG: hypothetical protein QOC77_2068 [Thermoleophilaceae bacterium]|jgi:hypothetical protein|nr:hypothetical protein [Thermoleophilaceae bacterium]